MTITALSASLGLAIATAVGASRVLFSMGREGLTNRKFGELKSGYQVPWNALHLIFGVGLLASLVLGAIIGPYNSYVWWATTSTFFAMVTYLVVNFANLLLNRHRILNSVGGFCLYALCPVIGIVVDAYILYRSFFVELWAQDWLMGKSVIVFDVACAIVAALVAIRTARSLTASTAPSN